MLLRFRVLVVLLIALLVTVGLNRLVSNWHYVVPVEPGEVAYVAAFDGFADDWNLAEGRLKAQILENGVLRLDVGVENSLPFAEVKPHFADFDLRVQATAVDGPEDNGFGVIFRLQNKGNASPNDDDFYLFLISSDGYYRVLRSVNGSPKDLSTWIPSDAIHTGISATNWLRVVAVGNQFRFYVNDQQLQLCIPDDPEAASTYTTACLGGTMRDTLDDDAIPSGQLGVAAQSLREGGVIVDFDNLVILGPQPL